MAFTIMSRIEDVLYADSLAQDPSTEESEWKPRMESSPLNGPTKLMNNQEEEEEEEEKEEEDLSSMETPKSMTLSDFMGWNVDKEGKGMMRNTSLANLEDILKDENEKFVMTKPTDIVTSHRVSYIEKLENFGGLRSPTARH